jgi:hypothetical protein
MPMVSMGPASVTAFYVLGVRPCLVLDHILLYNKTRDFSSTYFHLVTGEDGADMLSAHFAALSSKAGACFLVSIS